MRQVTLTPRHKHKGGENGLLCRQEIGCVPHIERAGFDPTLVFLHGIGSSSESFAPLFEAFPKGPRLIAWNAPGYSTSKLLAKATPTASDYAEALEQFFDKLNLDKATIVGHSLGSLFAVAFALRAPARVSSIVLAASAQGYGIGADEPLPTKAADRLNDLARLGPEKFAEMRAPRLVFNPEVNPSVVALVRQEMARINPDGYAQAVHGLASGDLAAAVVRLDKKPAFIIGAQDQITLRDQTEAAMHSWAKAHGEMPSCISIPNAGHAVYVQEPAAFADALIKLVPEIHTRTPSHPEGEIHG